MREFKFRAWDNKNKRLWSINEKLRLQLQGNSWAIDSLCEGFSSRFFSSWWDKDVELMQFTGLKDTNKTDIYEGDILKDEEREYIGVVEFLDGCFVLRYENIIVNLSECTDWVIIGNRYENLELLKELEVA